VPMREQMNKVILGQSPYPFAVAQVAELGYCCQWLLDTQQYKGRRPSIIPALHLATIQQRTSR
jgi:hypothetical protein